MTGGRLKRVEPYLEGKPFMATYGDGVSDIDIAAEIAFHRRHGKLATLAAVQPPGRFGRLNFDEDGRVRYFKEKPDGERGWINGGFFIFEPGIYPLLNDRLPMLERDLLQELVRNGEVATYRHYGYWMSCDKLRNKMELERMWLKGNAPWLSPFSTE